MAAGENTDPTKVVTAEVCGECHVSALAVWQETSHATGFKTLHRKESAAAIAERMGFKLIKRDSVCLDCHFTPTLRGEQRRAVSGVSCESCHGAGKDWIDVHNDYGGKDIDHKTESPGHRAERLAASQAAGMRRPSNLYAVASSCYRCHTVPNEDLVNIGRHSLGSAGFELVDWTQGEIRHNFLGSFLDGDGSTNAVQPPEHDRRLYVVGRALDVEYSLRGLAQATTGGVYLKAMQRRLRSAVVELRAIAQTASLPEVDEMIAVVKGVKANLGQGAALLAAADRIGAATRRFQAGYDGTQLASLDPLLEGGADAVALAEDEILVADTGTDAEAPAGGSGGGQAVDPGGSTPPGATTGAGSSAATHIDAIPAEGEKRRHLRPRSSHDTLAVTACQQCHGDQNAWWFDDRHYAAVDPFLDRSPAHSKIARLYGISPAKMARGDSLCMDCHGTFASGKERREVQDGVSCQSCHGPGADFLEPHQEGEKSLGRQRPGLQKALKLGMRDLADRDTRLRNCASCHYLTDPRLISAGHPSGAGFDIVAAMRQIRHWQSPLEPEGVTRETYTAVLRERGPVPQVRLARLASTASGGTATAARSGAGRSGTLAASSEPGSRAHQPRVFTPRPAGGAATAGQGAADHQLPPLPEVEDGTPIEEVLRLVQEQLKKLYSVVAPPRRAAGDER